MQKRNFWFDRAPSAELQKLFYPRSNLSLFLEIVSNTKIADLSLDVHFRRLDCIHVYCGLTRVIIIKRLKRNNQIKLTADKFYQNQHCGQRFLKNWRENDEDFLEELELYLNQVSVRSQHISKEGTVQLEWSRITNPWTPFDREVRLEYQSTVQRKELRLFDGVESAFKELMRNYDLYRQSSTGLRWAMPKKTALKLDQIAISPDGRLTLVELKHTKGSEPEIYYSPFQLLQYIWEWHIGLNNSRSLIKQVQDLLDARVELGLTSRPSLPLNDDLRAAVCFGIDDRSDEVKRGYQVVLDIVNRHLPPSVSPIETWEYGDVGPRRIF